MSSLNATEIRRKRLLWRATRRGIKEMDMIVGGYAQAHLPMMEEAALDEFEKLLEIPDQELLAYATNQEPIPQQRQSLMLANMLAFRPDVTQ